MKFSHNKPNSEPAINKFIEMKHPIPFLEPNCLYLMPSMPEEVAASINQTLTDMMDVNVKSGNLFNDYTCIHLRNLPFSEVWTKRHHSEGCFYLRRQSVPSVCL